ncbi:hypothetical protein BJ546DRAFT_635819 [Cryomyces antarcticus]
MLSVLRVSILLIAVFALLSVSADAYADGILPRQNAPAGTGATTTQPTTTTAAVSTTSSAAPLTTSRPTSGTSSLIGLASIVHSIVCGRLFISGQLYTYHVRLSTVCGCLIRLLLRRCILHRTFKLGISNISSGCGDVQQLTTATSALVTSATQRYVTTVVTVSGGSTISQVLTTSRVVASTTGFATYTSAASLNSGGGDGSSGSGLSSKSKSVIGGVVGGVGGAILLGGIALVAWRVWGRRGHRLDEDDELMGSRNDSIQREKVGNRAAANTPFQSTLDN